MYDLSAGQAAAALGGKGSAQARDLGCYYCLGKLLLDILLSVRYYLCILFVYFCLGKLLLDIILIYWIDCYHYYYLCYYYH